MGVGAAYFGLVSMLGANGNKLSLRSKRLLIKILENCTELDTGIQHLIGFVSRTSIHSIKRSHDDAIADWFYEVKSHRIDKILHEN